MRHPWMQDKEGYDSARTLAKALGSFPCRTASPLHHQSSPSIDAFVWLLVLMSESTRKYMSKRQRPCDFCRARKTACRIEGQLPCRLCALHNKPCTFVIAAQPRKRPTIAGEAGALSPSELRNDETAQLGANLSAYQSTPQFTGNPPQNHETTSKVTAQHENQQSNIFDSLADQFFSEFGEVAHDAQHGEMYSTLENGLSPEGFFASMDLEQSPNWLDTTSVATQLDAKDNLHPQILGYSGDMDPCLLQNYRYDESGAFKFKQLSIHSVSHGSIPTQFLLSQPGLFSLSRQEMGLYENSPDASREELETIVSADTGLRLIALFRRFILPQYPIFSESLFPDAQTSPPYLLAAIYMVAQPFARFDDVLSIELAYESLNTQALFKLVNEALHYESHNPSLAVVQTLVLLVLRPSTNPLILESSFKWSIHGLLISTSQTLGLHYDPASWTIVPWQIALRRRLSSTIFAIDKWLACSIGRPPLITRDAWLVTSVADTDNYAIKLSPETWSQHIYLSQLGELLGDVLLKL
jgi:hypothetical protein